MDERIKEAGYVMIGACRCIGPLTMKYQKGNIILYYAVKKGWIKVKERGRTIKYLYNENEIIKFLQEETT